MDAHIVFIVRGTGRLFPVTFPLPRGGNPILVTIAGIVWSPVTIALVIGVGCYLTIFTGVFQIRCFKRIILDTFGSLHAGKTTGHGAITPFAAMSTALGGTMGTGNIVGIATAIAMGGPGAIFWMWIAAVLGMMTKLAEVALAVRFRKRVRDGYTGGPMYYMDSALGSRGMAVLFCIFCLLGSLGMGNMVQANAIAGAMKEAFGFSPLATGIVASMVVGLVAMGGVKRIAKACEMLVPFMSVIYIVACIAAIVMNIHVLPYAFSQIFKGAFGLSAIGGGVGGYSVMQAMRYGIARGIFTNEAGLGSAPIAHASAAAKGPVEQGLWGAVEVFVDTIVCCTLTTLVILTADEGRLWNSGIGAGALTSRAFERAFGELSVIIVSVFILFFALTSMFGWSLYGERSIEYLLPDRKWPIVLFRAVYAAASIAGSVMALSAIWELADILSGLMTITNTTALFFLAPMAVQMVNQFDKRRVKIK